jgi:hypothetical protein
LADKPQLDGIRRRLLENFLVYYQRLIEQRRDDPLATAELAASRTRVRQILDDLAVMQGAGQHPLLKEPAVLDDLRLQPGQPEQIRERMDAMDKRWGDAFEDFRRLNPEGRRELFLRLARRTEADIEKVLTAVQRQRLRQIDLQRKGHRAFEEPDVSAALKLTAGQKEQIRTIRDKAFARKRERHKESGDPPFSPDSGASIISQIEEEVLMKEQRQRWRELTGEPFKGPLSNPRPGRPRPDSPRPSKDAVKK